MSETTLQRVNEVFREVFGNEELAVTRATTAADVDGWDSLTHVTLVLRVEREFGIRFKSSAVAELQSVGDLIDLVDRMTGGTR